MRDETDGARSLSIVELPGVVTRLFEAAGRPLLPGVPGEPGLFVRYLRRKPGRAGPAAAPDGR